jgi:hypothetical protein
VKEDGSDAVILKPIGVHIELDTEKRIELKEEKVVIQHECDGKSRRDCCDIDFNQRGPCKESAFFRVRFFVFGPLISFFSD